MEGKRKRDSSSGSEAAKKKGREDEKGEDVTKPKPQRRRKEAQEKVDHAQVELNASQAKLESSQVELKEAQKALKAAQQLWEAVAVVGNTALTEAREMAVEDARMAVDDARMAVEDARMAVEDARMAVKDARKLRDFWLNPLSAAEEVEKPKFIDWLRGAVAENVECLKVLKSNNGEMKDTPWGSNLIVVRPCYDRFIEKFMLSWDVRKQTRCVISGTPGIGKTTFVYYLLWKFLRGDLLMSDGVAYDVLVLGNAKDLVSIRMVGDAIMCQSHQTGSTGSDMMERSLGVFDIDPKGMLKEKTVYINVQQANSIFRVMHCVVVATAGCRLGEFTKKLCDIVYFPVWGSGALNKLCELSKIDGPQNIDKRGCCVPRLLLEDSPALFETRLEGFCSALAGVNVVGHATVAKNAHAFLVVQHSEELSEGEQMTFPRFAEKTKAGLAAGFVSQFVSNRLYAHMVCAGDKIFERILEQLPAAAPFHFQELVLNAMTTGEGLTLEKSGARLALKFTREECATEQVGCLDLGVLYRAPRAKDYMPSLDAFGVVGTTLYLLQVTKAKSHGKVMRNHVASIVGSTLPDTVISVHIIYVRPCGHGRLELTSPRGTFPIGRTFLSRKCTHSIVSVESLMATWPAALQKALCSDQCAEHLALE